MSNYRKKPVVIEAMEWQPEDLEQVGRVVGWFYANTFCAFYVEADKSLTIHTLEGDHRADIGDFIIRGVRGEFYPCKPDIFVATYEPAEAEAALARVTRERDGLAHMRLQVREVWPRKAGERNAALQARLALADELAATVEACEPLPGLYGVGLSMPPGRWDAMKAALARYRGGA